MGVGCEGRKGYLLLENELEQRDSEEWGTRMPGSRAGPVGSVLPCRLTVRGS